MTDTYSYQGDVQPGGGGQPARLTVRPPAVPVDTDLKDWTPAPAPPQKTQPKDESKELEDWSPKEKPLKRDISIPEAIGKGAMQAATFGLRPALGGIIAAGGGDPMGQNADVGALLSGGLKMLHNAISSHPDPEVSAAYERGRKASLEDQDAAKEQQPWAYFAGQTVGSMTMPIGGGALAPATLGIRALRGATTGAVTGGLQGAGEAVGEGKNAADVAKSGAAGAIIGAPLGGVFGAALGPRPRTGSPGERAAQTAEGLGAPLPRGVVSDNPAIQTTTSNIMSLPFVGPRIRTGVENTERAAGERIEDIAGGMAGPATDRASADAMIRPGIDAAIQTNRAAQNAAYNTLRGQIDHDVTRYTMPHTDATLNAIMRDRQGAGWPNPAEGLEQFRNVAGGATFNNAHRARVDARNAGNVRAPNPGYNAEDFNRLTAAMTADLRSMAYVAATNPTPAGRAAALRAFDDAERNFGPLAEMNDILHRLFNANKEGGVNTLLNASRERSGDLQLLAHLRGTMPAQQFNIIGGLLLSELGYSAGRGEFSLAQFATNFNKLSDGAVRTLFSPDHAENLRSIAAMGEHIKKALKTASTSHSSNWIAFVDILKDVALLSHDLGASGEFGANTAKGLGSTAVLYGIGWMLGNPAHAAALSRWSRAYQGLMLGPTPARIATFNIATRGFANTLGIPVNQVTNIITSRLGS